MSLVVQEMERIGSAVRSQFDNKLATQYPSALDSAISSEIKKHRIEQGDIKYDSRFCYVHVEAGRVEQIIVTSNYSATDLPLSRFYDVQRLLRKYGAEILQMDKVFMVSRTQNPNDNGELYIDHGYISATPVHVNMTINPDRMEISFNSEMAKCVEELAKLMGKKTEPLVSEHV